MNELTRLPQIPGISLMPQTVAWDFWQQTFSTDSVSLVIGTSRCSIDDKEILDRIFLTLTGVIGNRFLVALGLGIPTPMALFMFKLYRSIYHGTLKEDENQAERNVLQRIQRICEYEVQGPLPNKGKIPFYLNQFALWAGLDCWLRLDKQGYSTCSGNTAVQVQFVLIEVLFGNAVRFWFRHGVLLIYMDLSEDELRLWDARLHFFSDATWILSEGAEKCIICSARLMSKDGMVVLVRPSDGPVSNTSYKINLWETGMTY
jgi:hypothetical protein